MRVALIHNPTAGSGDHSGEALTARLRAAGHDAIYASTVADSLTAALNEAPDVVVVAGGDGTVAAVARLLAASGRNIPLAMLPMGTANNIAGVFGIVDDPAAMAEGLATAERRRFDVGLVRAPWGTSRFVESAGVGVFAGMLRDAKIDPAAVPWVPSNGAAPGLQDLVAGGVEFVPCSLPEARSLIDAGKVKSLAVMDKSRSSLFPNVPTLKEAVGSDWATGAWRGIAAPKGVPENVRARLEASVKKAYDSKEYKDFMAQRGFGTLWGNGAEFAGFMAKADADMKAVMTAVGIAK